MSGWMFPIVVEIIVSLLFGGILFYLRRSLTPRMVGLWLFLWVVRGFVSLTALRYLEGTERLAVVLYAPLQIAFALALVVIAVRLQSQREQLRTLNEELVRLRKEAASRLDIDPLTGLLNRSALTRWLDEEKGFDGLVVVCDMDDFKPLNDVYGHLVGDEILRGVGHLVRSSIREEDIAFRWGGDEFVIFFHAEDKTLVDERLHSIEERLQKFHIRHQGSKPVRFSWGIAPAHTGSLREALAEADRLMYEAKRARRPEPPPGRVSAAP